MEIYTGICVGYLYRRSAMKADWCFLVKVVTCGHHRRWRGKTGIVSSATPEFILDRKRPQAVTYPR